MAGLDLSNVPFDLIMNIINIVVLYVIVRALVYKPVRRFLDDRRQHIAAEREEVSRAETEADKLKAEYAAKLEGGETMAKAAVKRGEEEAQKKADEIIASAKNDARKMLEDAESAIAAKEQQTMESIKDDVVELSLGIASKVVGKVMTDEDNRRIAEEFFEKESENIR